MRHFVGAKSVVRHNAVPGGSPGPLAHKSSDPIAARLDRLEKAMVGVGHGAPTRMARLLGIGDTRWHNAKAGRGLSVDLQMILLMKIPGLSSDWLLLGRPEGLSYQMAKLLGVLDDAGRI